MIKWGAHCNFYFLAGAPSLLLAHAYLVKAIPAQRAVLFRAPVKIQLWFNERLEPRYSSIGVSDADGNPVEAGTAEVGAGRTRALIAKGGKRTTRPALRQAPRMART